MLLTLVLLVSLLIFIYSNTLFFTISLLLVIFLLLGQLALVGRLQTLTILMLLIVYVGAMMIMIGYICAIAPNLVTVSQNTLVPYFLLVGGVVVGFIGDWFLGLGSRVCGIRGRPVVFFYTPFGVYLFIVIALSLFVTLLMVTSQYSAPKGPFRSVS